MLQGHAQKPRKKKKGRKRNKKKPIVADQN
jgi:hypothetical protein